MSQLSAEVRIFVTRSLRGLGMPDLLTPIQERAQVDVWPGESAPAPSDLLRGVQQADGLLCLLTDRVDRALFEAAPRLRVVSSMSVGVDHIDLVAARERGIPVGHTPGVLAETTADLTLALMLAAGRRIPEADRMVRAGDWTQERRWAPDMLLGADLHGATLGLLGLGAIGRAVAKRALGFGMRVLGWTRSGRAVPGVEPATREAIFEASDFVSVHLALTPETRGLVGRAAISSMKPRAILVNTARGGIVDEGALAEALVAGRLGGAALDVFETEPLPTDSPLLAAPRLVLAPHIGSASVRTRQRMAALAVENLVAGLEGRSLVHDAS